MEIGDQLLDQDIKRAVEEQLAGKGLGRVESGGDLLLGCMTRSSIHSVWEGTIWLTTLAR